MAKATTVKEAIAQFEKVKGVVAAEAEKVELLAQVPPIDKLDGALSSLKACRHLCLSTNNIEKITNLAGMENLRILSLGRNQVKKLENLDSVSETLEELWISYNLLDKLVGIEKLSNLRVLFAANNRISAWSDVERLAVLDKLEEVLLVGNPLFNEYKDKGATNEYRIEVLKRLPKLRKLDGVPIDVDERELAKAA